MQNLNPTKFCCTQYQYFIAYYYVGKTDNTAIKDTAMRANEARKKILYELKDSNELLSTKEELKDFLKSKFIQCYRH